MSGGLSRRIRACGLASICKGLLTRARFRSHRCGTFVLMYHNVGREPEDRCTIEPKCLAAQWKTLVDLGYRNVDLDFVCEHLVERKPLNGRNFAITFDDGRDGIYHYALPLLQQFKFAATAFVVPSFLGGVRWFSYRKSAPSWVAEEESRNAKTFRVKFMPEEQLHTWVHAGQRVGSHTLSHQHLASLSDQDMQSEITKSARAVESRFGYSTGRTHFAYPYGEYNARVRRAAAGEHLAAFTCEQGAVVDGQLVHEIPRVDPGKRPEEMLFRLFRLGLI